jgi:TPR repeat protein
MVCARSPFLRLASAILAIALLGIVALTGDAAAQSPLVEAMVLYAKQDYEHALRLLNPLASQGDVVAQLIVGRMHLHGEGVSRNSFAAFEWLRQAANNDNADAQFEVAGMYRDGIGTTMDGQVALQWFKRAADRGRPDAFTAIGEMHLGHRDVPQHYRTAFEWFNKAAELGEPNAMYHLGMHYALGRDEAPNEQAAFMWFDLAADFSEAAVRARMALAERLTPLEIWAAKMEARRWKQNGCCPAHSLSDNGTSGLRVQ